MLFDSFESVFFERSILSSEVFSDQIFLQAVNR